MALTSYAISGAEDITYSDNYTYYNKAGVDSNGRIFVVYSRDTGVDDKPYLAYSDDGAQNWTEEQIDSLSNYDRVAMIADSSDNVHCVCCNQGAGSNALKYRRRNSDDSWETTETIGALGAIHHVNIAIDSSGTLWVTATHHDGSQYVIKVYKKLSGGSWSLSSTLTPTAGYHYKEHNMKIGTGDILHVAICQREVADSTKIMNRYNAFDTGLETWSGITTIDNGASETVKMPPSGLVVESDGTVWVFWENDGYGVNSGVKQIIYNKKPAGGAWGTASNLTDDANRYAYTCAVCTDNDSIVMFYGHIGGDSVWDLYYQTWNGSSWGSEVTVVEGGTNELPLAVVNDGNVAIYYIFSQRQGDATDDIYAATDGGGISADVLAIISTTPNIDIAPIAISGVIAYQTPDESSLPTDKNIERFVLLRPGDTGEGSAQRMDTWGSVGITCVVDAVGTSIEIYVSNDGTDYTLRETFTASGELHIKAAYKYIKAKQVSGSALVIVSGQKATLLY